MPRAEYRAEYREAVLPTSAGVRHVSGGSHTRCGAQPGSKLVSVNPCSGSSTPFPEGPVGRGSASRAAARRRRRRRAPSGGHRRREALPRGPRRASPAPRRVASGSGGPGEKVGRLLREEPPNYDDAARPAPPAASTPPRALSPPRLAAVAAPTNVHHLAAGRQSDEDLAGRL